MEIPPIFHLLCSISWTISQKNQLSSAVLAGFLFTFKPSYSENIFYKGNKNRTGDLPK
jgi:hypothetical protein